ncbi:MAG: putative hydroxymethylpyrimidine transporter CytX [Clostridia bacterium]|nr:putative hydroxymethylpyrimidine transporter CytX [Clostridia bacterium]
MKETKTSVVSNSLIWFGAGISIAEILTGTFIAPLGFAKGFAAIIIGHIIGCVLLFFAGLIGGKTEKSAMETVKISFGQKGSLLFSSLNVLQLVGWTAVMIVSGAAAAESIADNGSSGIWSVVIGALIIVWILIGIKNLDKVNYITMGALFILTIIMSTVIFKGNSIFSGEETISFGAAVELSVAMPLSWLPLISDYTRYAKKPFASTLAGSVTYFVASVWMYVIGMGAALFTGESDVALIMTKAGLGVAALVIIILSTVTTTFLDAYSAGVSCESISKKLKEKPTAIAVCIVGTLLAIFTPITKLEDFLYIIGSVFAPMIAIQISDYFILKKDSSQKSADFLNLVIWLAGFIIYRLLMNTDTPVGYTLPAMVIVCIICIIADKIKKAAGK